MMLGVLAFVLLVTAYLVGLAVHRARTPVGRTRLETFARRQRLEVTRGNGAVLLRCLTATQRWRTLGLCTGIAAGLLWALKDDRLTLDFTTAFLGWFVGAVLAEWRIAGLPRGEGRRTASLERRTVRAYLRAESGVLLGIALVLLLGVFVRALYLAARLEPARLWQPLGWFGVAVVGLVLVALTLRRVVNRPQPPAAPDLVAADDALRARAANVLTGSAIAAAGLPTASLFALVGDLTERDQGTWASVGTGILVLETLVGWLVAVTASPARARRPEPEAVATP